MDSSPKQIILQNEGIDRISDLPDSILELILSYLTTKNGVATSILSTRWKNLSPFAVLPIMLVFDDSQILHPKQNEPISPPSANFVEFVDKILNTTLSDVHCVDSMHLKCEKNYGDDKIVSWVSAALRLNVRGLNLLCSLGESYTLLHILNGCTALVKLTLELDSMWGLPDNFSLPNLKSLELGKLIVIDESGLSELIESCCPALEDLCLMYCDLQNLEDLYIASPRLKSLSIESCFIDSINYLALNTPNLQVLQLSDHVAWDYYMSGLGSLLVAHINVGPGQKLVDETLNDSDYDDDGAWRFDNCVAKLVTACSSTISLYLSACSITALCDSSKKLPEFQNLTRLSLGDIGRWTILARLLQNAPNLEELTIQEGFTEDAGGYADFKNLVPDSPICLEMHMKEIEFRVFEGDEDEIKLVEYFLKNGKVLQKLVLYCLPPDDISILTRLLMMPRQSKLCQIDYK